ncbi:DUF3810 domain-containing protein [Clostridium sp. AF32-12BH]|uniref:DUF3810 domain-containing protein n=1 Tax=Clostridium sp. AF32-12BH TaxID=2292006 RepID=UPI000E4C6D0C|nr:DUF3810 domain-containing protein [Clostridium sp. AF32-12BH]RHP41182.1 DUF3810 domain-containing protein [Clostridium sp. AF32-12BH]
MKKNKRYDSQYFVAAGISLLLLTAVFQLSARTLPGFGTWYAHHIYPWIVEGVGRLTGLLPFSVAEMGLYGLLCLLFLDVVRLSAVLIRPETAKILTVIGRRWLLIVGTLLFLYTVNCGINYYASSFSSYAGLEDGKYSMRELEELCEELVRQVNEAAKNGRQSYRENKKNWREESVHAMQAAGAQFPCLSGFYPKPKEVFISQILSVQQLCGVYSPFTVEANYNGDMPDYNVPHTLCHELSHLKGFMREDEANFIGYLACVSSENEAFRYSGYLTGWVYAGNALARADRRRYIELTNELCEEARTDLDANSEFWNRYESKVSEAATRMNDTYLKMNSQADGVKSYGRMVDLMLSYRRIQQRFLNENLINLD